MVVRLEAIDGVTTAEVDHRGEMLRFRAKDRQAVADAVATLRQLGYGADEMAGPAPVDRWYGRETVGELSREEGRVIAERVVHTFARARGMDDATSERLDDAIATALGSYFAAHSLGAGSPRGALRDESIAAATDAATAIIGPEAARELSLLLRHDLDAERW